MKVLIPPGAKFLWVDTGQAFDWLYQADRQLRRSDGMILNRMDRKCYEILTPHRRNTKNANQEAPKR